MADTDIQSLFLQVDASVELLRRNLASGEQPLDRFEQRAKKMATNVDATIASMGSKFGTFASMAESAAQKAEKSFNDSFTQIQKMAATAIAAPTVQGGGINIGAGDARAAATAAQQQAVAIRLIETAARAAAQGAGELTTETRLYLQAASAARIEAERHAAELTREAGALERLEIELRQAGAGQQMLVAQQRTGVMVSGQQRGATMMLGQQVQDFAVQVSNGGSVMTAFSQQIGQAAFAVQGMGGRMAGVAAFLGSGWGAAVLVALTVLTPLVGKMLEGNDALDDASDKLKKEAEQTEATRQAKELFAQTEAGVTAAIREGTEATKKSIEAQKTAAEQANIAAKQNLEEEISIRRKTQARLEDAKALLAAQITRATGPGQGSEVAALGLGRYQGRVTGLETQIAAQTASIAEAEARVQETRISLAEEAAKRMADPIERIRKLYDDQRDAAKDAARVQIAAGKQVTVALTQQLAEIERRREGAIKAEQARQSASRRTTPLGTEIRNEQAGQLLSSAQSYRGLSETRDNGTLRDLFGKAGMSVDPKMIAWCAAFVNAVLATNGLPGTASLSARSFLNYGTATSAPTKGDIVVSRRGTGSQRHVGFYEGTDAKGNVMVLGGNTGNRVGVQRVARDDVLGFRRAPTASAAAKSEDTLAKRAEAARLKALADDTAYTEDERQARRKLLDATRRTTASETQRDAMLREDINAEADAMKVKIANRYSAGDLGVVDSVTAMAKRDHLLQINEATRGQRLQNVVIARVTANLNSQFEAASQDRQGQIAILRIRQDMAGTTRERHRIALEILALEQEERRQALERIKADPSSDANAVQRAKDELGRLPAREQAERGQTEGQFLRPLDAYKNQLHAATDDMNEALEGVAVNGLDSLENGLLGIISGTESVGSAFQKMASSIIADLARIAIQKLIINAIGGSFFGLAGGGKIEGKAGGGMIRGAGTGTSDSIFAMVDGKRPLLVSNGESIVTAEATAQWWPLIDAMNKGRLPRFAKGGLVSPRLPSMRGLSSSRSDVVEQHFHVNAQGAVLAADLVAEMRSVGQKAAVGGARLARQQLGEQALATLS